MMRRFTTERIVRLGDVNVEGRLRLDALARYLQDIAYDDATDAGLGDDARMWVVRAVDVTVNGPMPTFGQRIELTTRCGGIGQRWAERKTDIGGGAIETNTLWVHIDDQGRPAKLPQSFHDAYADSAEDHKVSAKLVLPPPPPPSETKRIPWPVRITDHDVLGHVNNAVYWAAIETALADDGHLPKTLRLEHRDPIEVGTDTVELIRTPGAVWLASAERLHAAAVYAAP